MKKLYEPKHIRLQHSHKIILVTICKPHRLSHDARVGEEDIQPFIRANGIVHDGLDGRAVRRVKASNMHVNTWVERLDLTFMRGEIAVVVVAEVDGF